MADLSQIFAVLQAADKEAEARSPFRGLTSAGDQLSSAVVQASPKASTKDMLVSGLVSGLMSGLGQNLTNRYVDEQQGKARDVLLGSLGGDAVERPSSMSPSVFGSLNNAGSVLRQQRLLDQADLRQKAALELEKAREKAKIDLKNNLATEAMKAQFDNPYKAQRAREVLSQLFGQEEGSAALSSVTGPAQALPATDKNSKTYEDYLFQYQGDETLARAALTRDLDRPEKLENELQAIRKEFQGLREVRDFITSDIGYGSLREAIRDPHSTSDLELIRGAIQAIEPGMAVREGEAAAVEASMAIPDRWRGQLQKSLSGETALPPEVREGILRIAERRYRQYATKFNAARDFYRSEAERMGLPNPDAITYLPEAELVETATPQGDPSAALKELARQFPNTPEGRAAFKNAVAELTSGR